MLLSIKMSKEALPSHYEDKPIEVEGKHILMGITFSLLGVLIVGTGLIYYREGLKHRRQERLLETILSVVDLVTGEIVKLPLKKEDSS